VGAALAAIQPSAVQADGWWQMVLVLGIVYRSMIQCPGTSKAPERRFADRG
jgi:hypothetical protein